MAEKIECGRAHHWIIESDKKVPLSSSNRDNYLIGRAAICKKCGEETILKERIFAKAQGG